MKFVQSLFISLFMVLLIPLNWKNGTERNLLLNSTCYNCAGNGNFMYIQTNLRPN